HGDSSMDIVSPIEVSGVIRPAHYAATDLQVQTLASPLTVGAETAARKMPIFSTMLEQVIEKAPAQASRMLLNFKEVNWHAMNSFVHSGIHPLRRHAEGYAAGLI
ncbi:hypothetical protein A262_17769, partial [Pseudomonas syringae pv. actinidiae ICMP 19073]|uniref:DUF6988 family protein n=1 Tax=Pseudomonas syringae TaxID=317 RepID=UPI000357E760